jgi:antitoxin component YwqK of YwqJK toxin-antitoxin module
MQTIRTFIPCLFISIVVFSCKPGTPAKNNQMTVKNPVDTNAHASKPALAESKDRSDTLRDGDYTSRYPNGLIQIKGFYIHGKREGEWVAFFPSGKTQSEGFFTHGKRDHHAIVYYESGKKMYEGTYKEGVMVGKWQYYQADGTLDHEEDNGNGK